MAGKLAVPSNLTCDATVSSLFCGQVSKSCQNLVLAEFMIKSNLGSVTPRSCVELPGWEGVGVGVRGEIQAFMGP